MHVQVDFQARATEGLGHLPYDFGRVGVQLRSRRKRET